MKILTLMHTAVLWAQKFARLNRDLMMQNIIEAIRKVKGMPEFQSNLVAVNCHHKLELNHLHMFLTECA
jgi:tRNA-splicing ligase RtcB